MTILERPIKIKGVNIVFTALSWVKEIEHFARFYAKERAAIKYYIVGNTFYLFFSDRVEKYIATA